MSFFDSINPVRSLRRRRWTKPLVARVVIYVATTLFLIFVVFEFAPSRFREDRNEVASTRSSDEVLAVVQDYLKTATHHGFSNVDDEASACWPVFENKIFSVEYLKYGSWRVNAFYERARYFWRVDDETMEVTRDLWLQGSKQINPTIDC